MMLARNLIFCIGTLGFTACVTTDAPAIIVAGNVLAAPLQLWKIDQDDDLIISDGNQQISAYQLLSMSQIRVTVWDKLGRQRNAFTRKKS
jgi:hypothetical protein